jgi:uncharacterized membrane protein
MDSSRRRFITIMLLVWTLVAIAVYFRLGGYFNGGCC